MRFLPLLFLLIAHSAWGAVAYDSASSGGIDSDAGVITISHTITGSNVLLTVGVCVESPTVTVSSVTWNTSENLAHVADDNNVAFDNHSELWQLAGATTGTHNIVVTLSGNAYATGGGISFTGADQSTPLGTPGMAGAITYGTSSSATVTGVANGLIVDVLCITGQGGDMTLTPGGTQTSRYHIYNPSIAQALSEGSTNTATGSTSSTWSWTGGNYYSQIAAPVNPAGAVSTNFFARRRN